VVLLDELVAYVRQLEPGKSYPGGTFDSNITFIQALTEAMKGVPNAILLASLPAVRNRGGRHPGPACAGRAGKILWPGGVGVEAGGGGRGVRDCAPALV
jgi:hypothetical protein